MSGEDFLACDKVVVLDKSVDPYAYVVSANIRRRHLSTADKDRVIVRLLKADPTKSNRAVAKLTDTSHPHVAKVRKRAERTGDVETVTTSVDTKGRKQPSKRANRAKAADPPPQPSNEMLQQRAAAAERIRALTGRPKPAHNDIGADSGGEIKRLRERNEELENENACLRRESLALRSEIDELRARLLTVSPPADDGLDIPEFLRRTAP
jgi:hypothetical protein